MSSRGEAIEHCHGYVRWYIEAATGKCVSLVKPCYCRQSLLVQAQMLGIALEIVELSTSTDICRLGLWVLWPNSLMLFRLLASGQFHVGMTIVKDLM